MLGFFWELGSDRVHQCLSRPSESVAHSKQFAVDVHADFDP